MPEFSIPTWLLPAFTGGLAGSMLTLLCGWIKAKKEAKKVKAAQLGALKQELRHAQWLIKYNYDRIHSPELPNKGLTSIGGSNVEQILFSSASRLPLTQDILDHLHNYLQQVAYHNSLIAEYTALLPFPAPQGSTAIDRKTTDMYEIAAICTQELTYKYSPGPSLLACAKLLLIELEKIKT